MKPNNVTRMLDAKKVRYTAFELPAEKLGALETARLLGLAPEQVFKTIVVTREGKGRPILAVTPGDKQVDLKALAKALGEKKLFLPSERDAERLTSLQAGGISPLALVQRGFQVVIDLSARAFDRINISGGQRGLSISLPPGDLAALTQATFADFAR
jgi:Cys-tRNA(Pro)/Cys-tRNA(Cys) deacylase